MMFIAALVITTEKWKHSTTWMNLENTPSERNKSKGPRIVLFHLYEMSRMGESIKGRLGVA